MDIRNKSILSIFFICSVGSIFSLYFPVLGYLDELILCIGIGMFVIDCIHQKKVHILSFELLIVLLVIYCIGYISNLASPYHIENMSIALDSIQTFKPFIFFIVVYQLSEKNTLIKLCNSFIWLVKSFAVIGIILAIVSQFHNTSMSNSSRYGIHAFNFTFSFAGEFGFFVVFCFLIFLNSNKKIRRIWFVLCLILMLMSTKLQVISFLFFYCIFTYLLNKSQKSKVLLPLDITIFVLLMYKLSYSQLYDYFLDETHYSPRKIFFQTALDIAKNHFPIGLGFGSFGSSSSSLYYSPVYVFYGFDLLYALDRNGGALNDNYFASILGQFGFLGLFFLILFFWIIIKKIKEFENKKARIYCYSTVSMYILAGFGSGTIRSATGMLLFGFLAMIFANQRKEN